MGSTHPPQPTGPLLSATGAASPPRSTHLRSVLTALLVTFLWSTSWVLIKIGLRDIPPLSFAGLRYLLAFLFLLPAAARAGTWNALRSMPRGDWLRLALLGLVWITITQGAQFVGLAYLPSATVNLLLSFSTVLVAFLSSIFLGERPSLVQWLGLLMFLAGTVLYFSPLNVPQAQTIGLVAVGAGVLANALSAVMGRSINRKPQPGPLAVTTASMGIGALVLFGGGVALQGLPALTPVNWLIVLWLAAVNSALAFWLWNRTLQHLTAVESSVINNTMLFQISLLAWVFLGEALNARQIFAILIAVVGTLAVQLGRGRS